MKRSFRFPLFLLIFSMTNFHLMAQESEFAVEKRSRLKNASGEFQVKTENETWIPSETALIICDMWDKHWCPDANRRVAELAPFMNEVVKAARDRGIFIIHAPSDVTDYYAEHPARKKAMAAPKADNLPGEIQSWCSWLDEDERSVYPIDQSDGGCESEGFPSYEAWTKQVADIEIWGQDAISASGKEIWNMMEDRGIENVLLMGVHTNMCVLGRPFGLRNMSRYGKNVVLVRDLTDTMYNPKSWPYVDHYTGTDLIVEHIEKYVCPTILSSSLTGKKDFRFSTDERSVEKGNGKK